MLSRFWTRALLEGNLLIPQDLLEAYQSCVKESLCVARHKENTIPISGQNFDYPLISTERTRVSYILWSQKSRLIHVKTCAGTLNLHLRITTFL